MTSEELDCTQYNDRYISRTFYKDEKKLTQTFHVERVSGTMLYGELFQSETLMHEQRTLNALIFEDKRWNFQFSTQEQIREFLLWKGEINFDKKPYKK